MSQPSERHTEPSLQHSTAAQAASAHAPVARSSASTSAPSGPPAGKKKRRWLRWIGGFFLILLILIVLALAALWIWSGREGSLAQAITLAQRYVPVVGQSLQADNVQGSIRHGGHISHLRWQQEAIDIQLTELDLAWQSSALFTGKLLVNHITADKLQVITHPVEKTEPSSPSAPPADVGLPIQIELGELKVNTFIFGEEAQGLVVSNIAVNYRFDGNAHHLGLDSLHFAQGNYQAQVTLSAANPKLDAQLLGQLISAVPGSEQQAQVNAAVNINGLLTELHIQADAQATVIPVVSAENPAAANSEATSTEGQAEETPENSTQAQTQTALPASDGQPTSEQNAIHLQATVTPWQPMILPQADLTLHTFDASAFWPQAPHTALSGAAHVTTTRNEATQQDTWQLQTQINNSAPGVLDQGLLPVSGLEAQAAWQGQTITIDQLHIGIGQGAITAQGQLQLPAQENTAIPENTSEAQPASTASTPLTWQIQADISPIPLQSIHSQLGSEQIYGTLQARQQPQDITFDAALKLAEATINGQGTYILQNHAANGKLDLTAPGLLLHAQADQLNATSGSAQATLELSDAQKTLAWIQATIPLLPESVHALDAKGNADVQFKAENGWQNPLLDAQIHVTDLLLSQKGPQPRATTKDLVHLQDTLLSLKGNLNQATLEAQITAALEQQQVQLQLQAQGGQQNNQIVIHVNELGAGLAKLVPRQNTSPQVKPLLSLNSAQPFQVSWQTDNQRLEVSPGTLDLQIADHADITPSLAWEKSSWQAGEIISSGKLAAFPVTWLTSLAPTGLSDLNLSGDLMFEGSWQIRMGSALDFSIEIARSGGDLTLEPDSNAFFTTSTERLQAGIRDARIKLYNEGRNVHAELIWDSENASVIQLKATTVMQQVNGQWSISEDAPLSGEAVIQLQQIGIASALAPTGWRFSGAAILDSQFSGTLSRPQLKGRLTAMGISLRSVLDGVEFTDGIVQMTFDGDHVKLNDFSIQGGGTDGGIVKAQGEFDWSGQTPLASLKIVIDKLRASIRNDRQLTASGQVNIDLKDNQLNVTGNVGVDQALIILGDSGAPALDDDVVIIDPRAQAQRTESKDTDASRTAATPGIVPHIALTFNMGRNFRVQGYGLQTYLRGELAVGNQGFTPRLIGDIETFNGRFRAYAQNLNIETGIIRFSGTYNNPTLNILAIRPNLSETVGVKVTGTAMQPSIQLYSASGLPDSEILSWLVLGRPASADGKEAAILQQAALALLSGGGGTGITEQLANTLGLDEISFGSSNSTASSGNEDDTLANATITLSKRLSDNFYVSYEHSLTGAMGTFYAFYEISRRLTLRGESGENTAVDLIYTFRFDGK